MSAPLALLRFPRDLGPRAGTYGVTTADGAPVMRLEVSQKGRQLDVTAPAGEPLGRGVKTSGHEWQLLAPGTGLPVAHADTRHGVRVRIGAGPPATVKGRNEWDLDWEGTTLLAVRTTPRKVAKRCLDVFVNDPACTPAVVAFVLHVRGWWVAAETTNQIIIQQTLT